MVLLETPAKSGRLADAHPGSFTGDGDRFVTREMAIMTEDMGPLVDYLMNDIFGNHLSNTVREKALQIARDSLPAYQSIFRQAFPGRDWVIHEQDITTVYEQHVKRALEENPAAVIVINDRYIARDLDKKYPDNIFRFSSTRILEGSNTGLEKSTTRPRPGDLEFEAQLDTIEARLQETGRSLDGATVIFADDVTVRASTESSFVELFSARGARVDTEKSIYVYKVFPFGDKEDPDTDRPRSAGRSLSRNASAEQREFTPLGGPVRRVGNFVALQQPAQFPWGSGGILRTDGFIQQRHLSQRQLELFIDVFGKIEKVLHGSTRRRDGTIFEYFSFADFKWMIPVAGALSIHPPHIRELLGKIDARSLFGPSTMVRQYRETHSAKPHLSDLRILDYVQAALDETRNDPKPTISHVVVDIDGAQLQMKYEDSTRKTFVDSLLGQTIISKLTDLVGEYTGNVDDATEILERSGQGKSLSLLTEFPDFARFLEEKYGEETLQRLRTRFNSFYGEERGRQEFDHFLAEYNFLPLAYHVLREFTWGEVQFSDVFKPDKGKSRDFSHTVVDNGGTMVFLSSAPRINAMRILETTGQADLVQSGRAVLITVEDLYHPETLDKASKQAAIEALKMQTDDMALRSLQDSNRENEYDVYKALRDRLQHVPKTHASRTLCIGDQLFSDVREAILAGGYGYLVNGPNDLENIFQYARIYSEKAPRLPVTDIFMDIDGAVLQMKFPPGYPKRRMSHSVLGEQVRSGFGRLIDSYVTASNDGNKSQSIRTSLDLERPVETLKKFPGFAQFLEEKYGQETLQRLAQRFDSFYGPERGPVEYQQFLEQYKFLPLAYHVLREFTWGEVELGTAFEINNGKTKMFCERVIRDGGRITFLTAGPKIHALDMLQTTALQEIIVSGQARLVTVEDLYDDQMNESGKETIFAQAIGAGISASEMVSIGDQVHSDVYPLIPLGVHGIVVDGQNELGDVLDRIKIKKPSS